MQARPSLASRYNVVILLLLLLGMYERGNKNENIVYLRCHARVAHIICLALSRPDDLRVPENQLYNIVYYPRK